MLGAMAMALSVSQLVGRAYNKFSSRMAIDMSTTLQHHPRHRAFWAFVTGLLLAGLLAVVQMPSPTRPLDLISSYILTRLQPSPTFSTVLLPSIRTRDSERAPIWPGLFDMDIELLTQGDVLNKWNDARLEIARELQIVDRCRTDNVGPAVHKGLLS